MYSKFSLVLEHIPRPGHCGCLSLRAGAVLVALISILYTLLAMSQCIAEVTSVKGEADENSNGKSSALYWAFFGSLIALLATSVSLGTLMLVGALREKAWMLRPWLVFKAMQLGGSVLCFIVSGVLQGAPERPVLAWLAAQFLAILVRFYMLTVVASYCRQLEDARGPPGQATPLWGDDAPKPTQLYTSVNTAATQPYIGV